MRILDLFSGIGGFTLAAEWTWPDLEHAGFVEFDPYCQALLKLRFPNVPIHGDIKTYKGERGSADIVTGGFPCQPFSAAGKRQGTDDDRHLWPEMLRVIREVQPSWVIGENVAGLTSWNNGLVFEEVISDLETEGYEVGSVMVPAVAVNAPHRRDRIWIVAHSLSSGTGGESGALDNKGRNPRKSGGTSIRQAHRKVGTSGANSTSTDASDTTNESSGGLGLERKQNEETAQFSKPRGDATDTDNTRKRTSRRRTNEDGQEKDEGWKEQSQLRSSGSSGDDPNTSGKGLEGSEPTSIEGAGRRSAAQSSGLQEEWNANWAEVAAELCGMDDGLPSKLDGFELSKPRHWKERLKGLGNAIVPQVAARIMQSIKHG